MGGAFIGGRVVPSRARIALAAGVAGLLAAGCATRAPAPVPVAPPPTMSATIVPPPPREEPRSPEEARNLVAVLVPTSGPQAAVGQSIANAALLALIDLKTPGFRLTTYDTAGPGGARGAAEAAVVAHAGVILGPLLAGDVRSAAPIAAAAGVPMLSFTNDAAVAGGGTYVLGFQPTQAIARAIGFARARGLQRFGALVPAGIYGQRATTAFLRAVQATGGVVTGIATYTRDKRQLAAAARKVTNYEARLQHAGGASALRPDGTVAPVAQRAGPVPFEALMIADSGPIAAAFGPALAQFGAGAGSVRLLGTELWANELALGRAPGMRGAWFAAVPDARFAKMSARYRARYGTRPSRLASLGYDAVLLVQTGAARWSIGSPFPRAVLSDRGGFTGVDGVFRFTPGGVAERALEVRQVGAAGSAVVSPAPSNLGG